MNYCIQILLLAISIAPYAEAKKHTHLRAESIKCKALTVLFQAKIGNLIVCNDVLIKGNLAVSQNLAVGGNVAIANNLAVNGTTTLNNLIANSAVVGGVPFGSLLAYAYATNPTPGAIIANNADLIFTRTNSFSSANVTFSPDTPTFTSVTVPAGTYFFAFSVSAIGTTFPGDQLSFALFNQTAGSLVPNTQYNSEQGLVNPFLTKGYGLASFAAPTTVSLRNLSTQPVQLATGFPPTTPVIDSLTLVRIAA